MSKSEASSRPDGRAPSGPCVTELGSGVFVGTAGRNGVVLLGAGGAVSGVPAEEGDLESSGIHRFDLTRIRREDTGAREVPAGASVWVEPGSAG
ncbi:MAG: hypothetical protein QNK05_02820 [Myxococcota bacterium]|nr:hypothetical protein [Myxococcota bacterium]